MKKEIESKYNIGDTVYYISDDKIRSASIISFMISLTVTPKEERIFVLYELIESGCKESTTLSEVHLYSSKSDLIASL